MFQVKEFMTKNPICVESSEKITAVVDLMKSHRIHRIPVIDQDGKLVGLITEGMIVGNNSPATSLSIYELNYLLAKTEVKTVMEKRTISVKEEALLEEATQILLDKNIGCLPVIDVQGKVTGILTQNDIFKAFLKMLGWDNEGTRLIIKVKDEAGELGQLGSLLAQSEVDISTIGVYPLEENSMILLRSKGKIPAQVVKEIDQIAGFQVIESKDHEIEEK